MKLKISAEQKKYLTMADAELIPYMQAGFQEQANFKDEYQSLANFIVTGSATVLSAEHTIAKNAKVYNRFGTEEHDTEHLDIWFDIICYDNYRDEFYKVGAYLSDVWDIGGVDSDELKRHMYIRRYRNS